MSKPSGLVEVRENHRFDTDALDEASSEEVPPVSHPTKLIRIASMTRAMLDEARQAPLDEGGRQRLAEVHSRSVEELREVLSPDLQEEFNELRSEIEGIEE